MEIENKNYLKETITIAKRIESAFLELAARLKNIRDNRLYDGEYQNFAEFLWEIKIAEGTASKLIKVYETFILKFKMKTDKLSAVGWSSLYQIANNIETKEEAEEWVDKAVLLTRDHLVENLKEKTKGVSACQHQDTYVLRICKSCGFRQKEFE